MNTLIYNKDTLSMLENLEKEIVRIQRTVQTLKNKACRDDLTGLLRRDEFFGQLEAMIKANKDQVAVIMLDIDNFKHLNDTLGHQAGDCALQRVAKVVSRTARAGACSGRYGGEEFIIAHCGSAKSALSLAEALRRQIEREVNVTVSVGVATAFQAELNISKMVGLADKALYQAKRSGKNRVCWAA